MADADLTIYPGTPAFPTTAALNAGTDSILVITDQKKITGEDNAAGKAPVNRALKKLRDQYLGLRDATLGDVTGAVKKTFKSIYADATGGATHTKAAGTLTAAGGGMAGVPAIEAETGDIRATQHNIHAVNGDIIADAGIIQALNLYFISGDLAASYSKLAQAFLLFVGTVASGSNPASTVATPNQLRALNIPKAWASFTTNGMVGSACIVSDAHAITSVTRSVTRFTITFATAFDNAEWSHTSGTTNLQGIWVDVTNKAAGSCDVHIYDTLGIKDPVTVDTDRRVSMHFFGRQTT